MNTYLHWAGGGLLAVSALVATAPAQALEFGAWQVNLADIAHYAEPGQFTETPSVCAAFWVGTDSYLLFALLPGGERLIQASGQNWNLADRRGDATVAIGSFAIALDDAIYGKQFVDHVTSDEDDGATLLGALEETLGATADTPATVRYLDEAGAIMLEVPFDGFLPAIGGLLDCRRVVYGE